MTDRGSYPTPCAPVDRCATSSSTRRGRAPSAVTDRPHQAMQLSSSSTSRGATPLWGSRRSAASATWAAGRPSARSAGRARRERGAEHAVRSEPGRQGELVAPSA